MFDIQLVFDTYISSLVSEVESAKEELEAYAKGLEEDVAERTEQLRDLACKDELTQFTESAWVYENLRRELAAVERYKESLSFAYFDLDGFKKLNDTQGHQAGDALLSLVGKIMLKNIREVDVACRYGGDEFCIIMPRTLIDDAVQVMERIIESFKKKNKTTVSFSVGITTAGADQPRDIDSLIKAADTLMYKSKAKSKKKPGFYISIDHLVS